MTKTKKPLTRLLARSLLRNAMKLVPLRATVRLGARLGVVPGAIWRRLPAECAFRVGLPGDRSFRYHAHGAEIVGRALYWGSWDAYEPEATHPWFQLAKTARVVLDVGAFTGLYSLLAAAANSQAKVIAVEPVPAIRERLLANIALNSWSDRCIVQPVAASNETGEAPLHVPHRDVPGTSSLHATGDYSGEPGETITVRTAPVDDLVDVDDAVDLIKLDVEGFQGPALAGMAKTLDRCHPVIIFEFNPGDDADAIDTALAGHGYQLWHLRLPTPVAIADLASFDAVHPDWHSIHGGNFLAAVTAPVGFPTAVPHAP